MKPSPPEQGPLAVEVSCTEHSLRVVLSDGREIAVPLDWFPRLRNATPEQRRDWSLIGKGVGIHWESADEDISIESLLTPEKMLWARGYGPAAPRRRSRSGAAASRAFRTQSRRGRQAEKAGA